MIKELSRESAMLLHEIYGSIETSRVEAGYTLGYWQVEEPALPRDMRRSIAQTKARARWVVSHLRTTLDQLREKILVTEAQYQAITTTLKGVTSAIDAADPSAFLNSLDTLQRHFSYIAPKEVVEKFLRSSH